MKERAFLILIIISLIAINGFSLFRFYRFKLQSNKDNAISFKNENRESDELYSYKLNFMTNILNSNLQLDNIMIKDSLNSIIPMKEAFYHKQKQLLVCRFSQTYCESCVNFSILILRTWVDSIGVKNVMFLGNYRNNRIFNRTIPLYGIQGMKVYNGSEINIPAEKLGYPYYFVLDSNLQISNVFVPNKGLPDLTSKYLKNIHKRFFNLMQSK